MTRHLTKTVNLSDYKSYISGKMHAYKDNTVVDITQFSNQEKYNVTSNHSMIPVTVVIDKWAPKNNGTSWHLSWNTLHRLYTFLKNIDEGYISCYHKLENDNLTEAKSIAYDIIQNIAYLSDIDTVSSAETKQQLNEILQNTVSALGCSVFKFIGDDERLLTYKEIKDTIISLVEEGKSDNGVVKYEQDLQNMKPCEDETIYSYFEIPVMITNSIDNLGQVTNLIEEWKPNTAYKPTTEENRKSVPSLIVAYENDAWILKQNAGNGGYEWDDEFKESYFNVDDWIKSIQIYNEGKESNDITEVKGTVSSQLQLFMNKTLFYDELGNSINAEFIVSKNDINEYHGVLRPNENDSLSLQYKVGSVNNHECISGSLYWGNILHSITFHVEANGEQIGKDFVVKDLPTGYVLRNIYENYTIEYGEDEKLHLLSISDSELKTPFQEALDIVEGELKCMIKYNIGGFIEQNADGTFKVADNRHHGIEYTDTFTIERKPFIYNRSVSERYGIYYYELKGEMLGDDYTSECCMRIPNQFISELYGDDLFTTVDEEYKFDAYRGFMYSPTIREDFYLGTATQEKVSGNIYINRGFSSAFEQHLKLQELNTLQDLENYSNGGFFNVTSNN